MTSVYGRIADTTYDPLSRAYSENPLTELHEKQLSAETKRFVELFKNVVKTGIPQWISQAESNLEGYLDVVEKSEERDSGDFFEKCFMYKKAAEALGRKDLVTRSELLMG